MILNYEKQYKEGICKVLGGSVVYLAFYADFVLCRKSVIITTLRGFYYERGISLSVIHLADTNHNPNNQYSKIQLSRSKSLNVGKKKQKKNNKRRILDKNMTARIPKSHSHLQIMMNNSAQVQFNSIKHVT